MLKQELLFLRDYFEHRMFLFSKVALLYRFAKGQCGNILSEFRMSLLFSTSFAYLSHIRSGFHTSHWPQVCFKVNNAPSYIKKSHFQCSDSTTSQSSLFQYLATSSLKKFFLMLKASNTNKSSWRKILNTINKHKLIFSWFVRVWNISNRKILLLLLELLSTS